MEISNSAGLFWDRLGELGLTTSNYTEEPEAVGQVLLRAIDDRHAAADVSRGGSVLVDRSSYLVLSWNGQGRYQLHQFPLHLFRAEDLSWSFRPPGAGQKRLDASRCLLALDGHGVAVEWYGRSGGQLKYYPLARNAIWCSPVLELEPVPQEVVELGLVGRARSYFPNLW